jgi:hypothetical protein
MCKGTQMEKKKDRVVKALYAVVAALAGLLSVAAGVRLVLAVLAMIGAAVPFALASSICFLAMVKYLDRKPGEVLNALRIKVRSKAAVIRRRIAGHAA